MLLSVLLLLLSLGLILLGAELFTNGIEWFGRKLKLAEGPVGNVLAAVGTALPETIVPIVAIVSGGSAGDTIGIGAILGAPLMLSTLAFFVTGVAVLYYAAKRKRSQTISVDPAAVGRDLQSFFIVFAVAVAAGFFHVRWVKIAAAVFLLAAYAYYVRETFRCAEPADLAHDLEPLHISRHARIPRFRVVVSQVLISLALIVGGAHVFVDNLSRIALASGASPLILATIICPIATELPEKFNSVIWIRRRKDKLAIGNITGAMVFQSSIPTAIGLLFTRWELTPTALAAAAMALLASGFTLIGLKIRGRLSPRWLMASAVFYVGYLAWVFGAGGK